MLHRYNDVFRKVFFLKSSTYRTSTIRTRPQARLMRNTRFNPKFSVFKTK